MNFARLRLAARCACEPVELGHVVVQDPAALLLRELLRLLADHLPRVRPGRVAVGEVAGPHQPARIAQVGGLEGHPVVLEGDVDVLGEVLARPLRERAGRQPVAVPVVGVVHPVHEVRHPAGVRLHAHDLELREALEDAAEHEQAHDVLAAADDREEGVEARAARLALLAHGQDVEREREAEVDGRLPERVVHRVVVVLVLRHPGHHHAAQPQLADPLEIGDRLGDAAHRRLSDPEQTLGVAARVLRDPQVVGVEAGLLVGEVPVVAEHHADGRVEDLAGHSVALLVGEPRVRIPAAAVHLVELGAEDGDLLRGLPGRGDQAHRDRLLHAVDHEDVAELLVADHPRRAVAEGGLDPARVGVGGLGDVGIGGEDREVHGGWSPPCRVTRGARKCKFFRLRSPAARCALRLPLPSSRPMPSALPAARSRLETAFALALAALASLRVAACAAAFPFFSNVDEQKHVDMALKYADGYLPQPGREGYQPEMGRLLGLYGSPEYLLEPSQPAPAPAWRREAEARFAVIDASQRFLAARANKEAEQPPVYYLLAGGWLRIGRALGLGEARLLYFVRLLGALAAGGLVLVADRLVRDRYREEALVRWGVPLLAAVFPQDTLFYVTPDALSPLLGGLCFALSLGLAARPESGRLAYAAAGLSLAAALLTKFTNGALWAVAAAASAHAIAHAEGGARAGLRRFGGRLGWQWSLALASVLWWCGRS